MYPNTLSRRIIWKTPTLEVYFPHYQVRRPIGRGPSAWFAFCSLRSLWMVSTTTLPASLLLTRQWDGWDGSWWWETMKEGFVCGLKKVVFLLNAMWLKGMWFDWIKRNVIVIKMWFCQKITQVQLQACFAEMRFAWSADQWRRPLCHVAFYWAKHVRFIQGQMRASVRAEQDQKSRWNHKHINHLGDPQSEVPSYWSPTNKCIKKVDNIILPAFSLNSIRRNTPVTKQSIFSSSNRNYNLHSW